MDDPVDADDEPMWEDDFDSHGDAWFANLLFWRPSKLSDERMQLHFSEWDGRWSHQTKLALERFGAKGLDLNENWSLCAPYWTCPACRRSKNEIFRLSKRGILLAKLELHHDHLRDRIWHRARELFGEKWLETFPKSSIMILDHIKELASRFDRCLLCSECNAADGKVKARFRVEIDTRFSFTAQEIGAFIHPRAGQDHTIDEARAYSIWQAEKVNFFGRIKLIDDLLSHTVRGQLTRDSAGMSYARGIVSAFDTLSLLAHSFQLEARDTERATLLSGFRNEFLARSTQRDSAKLTPANSREKLLRPTDDEYALYVDPVSTKTWRALAEDWTCPVCDRVKRQILRKSKTGKWTGGVRSHYECTLEADAIAIANRCRLFPDFRNDIFVREITPMMLCSDCAGISVAVSQRDQSIRDPYLSVADRRACIRLSQPHSPHDIDFEAASHRALANDSYRPAFSAWDAFREKVLDFAGRFERGRKYGVDENTLLKEFADDIHVFHRIENPQECMNLSKWILTQRQAFL
jgi:rubredoxin